MNPFPAHKRQDLPVTVELSRDILTGTIHLPGADFRVMIYYLTAAPLGDTVREPAKDIAQYLGLSAGSISKSIKRLRDGGWLERSYEVGRVPFYRVGPRVIELAATSEAEEPPLAEVHHLQPRTERTEEQ